MGTTKAVGMIMMQDQCRFSPDGQLSEEHLIDKHFGLVVTQVRRFKPSRVCDKDDFTQVAQIGLLKAIRTFDATKGAFGPYAARVIRNSLCNEIRKFRDKTEILMNGEEVLDAERSPAMWESLPTLSSRDIEIVELKRQGFTNKEIGEKLGSTKETIRRALQAVKVRIREANK